MFLISEQGISEYIANALTATLPLQRYAWSIDWLHKDGGLKTTMYLGNNENVMSVQLELNERLCGAGSILLSHVDFPIDYGDDVKLNYNGDLKYRAIVTNKPDPKGGIVELMPHSVRFKNLIYNGSFTAKTIEEILETVIEAVYDDSGIVYNSLYINTGSTDTYTIEYEYKKVEEIIKDLVKRLDGRAWGVDVNNIFRVYIDNTTVDQYLWQMDNPIFTNIEIKEDYDNIKATRYQVFRKDAAGETVRAGQVGYDAAGGSYPTLAIEQLVGKIEDNITVSDLLSTDAEALGYAYSKLQAETDVPLIIDVKGVDVSRYFPVIGHLIKCQDREEKILRTIIDCESVTDWSGSVTLDSDDYVEGSGSIEFTATAAVQAIEYDLGELKRWKKADRIGFMIKADYAGDYLELFAYSGESPYMDDVDEYMDDIDEYMCSYGSTYDTSVTFHIPTGGVWNYIDLPLDIEAFRYIGFRVIEDPPASCTINIDRIQLNMYHRTESEGNVKLAKISIDKNGESCEMTLNKIDAGANDMLFSIDKKIAALEAISQQ